MIPTCHVCDKKLLIVDGEVQLCPLHGDYAGGRMYPFSATGLIDGHQNNVGTDKPCLKRIVRPAGYGFCQLPEGHEREHDGEPGVPCFTMFISDPPPPSDFGPKAATATRRGR